MIRRTADPASAGHAVRVELSLHALWLPGALTLAAACLAVAYVLTSSHAASWGADIARLFDLNEEANIPAWFSSVLWLAAVLLALAVFRLHRERGVPYAGYWFGMVPLFLLMSLDEAGQLHETFGSMIGRRMEGQAILDVTYAWVVLGLAVVALIGMLYLRFLLRCRPEVRRLLVLSAGLFLTGAVIVESIGAAVESGRLAGFPLGLSWTWMIIAEEMLEMMGVILLIHTLLTVMAFDAVPAAARPQTPPRIAPGLQGAPPSERVDSR